MSPRVFRVIRTRLRRSCKQVDAGLSVESRDGAAWTVRFQGVVIVDGVTASEAQAAIVTFDPSLEA